MMNNYLIAQRNSAQARLRIATGKKFNTAADRPAGFGFVTRQNARLASIQQAKKNTEKAQSLGSMAFSAMSQIEENILTIRTNVLATLGGGLSESEIATKQLEIDAAVNAIDALVSSTTFGGKRLLQGIGETTISSTVSGANSSQVKELELIKTDPNQATQRIDVNIDSLASQAELTYRGRGSQRIRNDAEFILTGSLGSTQFAVFKDDSLSGLRDEINALTAATGVTASLSGNDLLLSSTEFGSGATVEVDVTSGTFNVTGGNGAGFGAGNDA